MATRSVIPFGPQHPVLPEPVHLDLVVEDEHVIEAIPQIGFVHRGLEKLVEKRDYNQFVYIAERVCGICSFGHGYGYASATEKLLGIEIPRRADYLRAILEELSRIHSHLLWLGLLADAFGFESLFNHCWRLRETILDIFQETCGGRIILSITIVGGMAHDIDDAMLRGVCDKLDGIQRDYREIVDTMLNDSSVRSRLEGVGAISFEDALELSMVGPFAKGSGVEHDMRTTGFGAYGDLEHFEPIMPRRAIATLAARCAARRFSSPSPSSRSLWPRFRTTASAASPRPRCFRPRTARRMCSSSSRAARRSTTCAAMAPSTWTASACARPRRRTSPAWCAPCRAWMWPTCP